MTTGISELTFQGDNGRDEFKREQVADRVIQLLTSDIGISPMVIDGGWGTGKTEFCQKLINKFRETHDNYRLLYIDAFQADHANNPLMTVLSAVFTLMPEGKKKASLLQKALPVMRYGMTTAGKAVFSHVLKQNADQVAEGLEEHLQDAADKAIDASIKALLKDHEKAEENITALQKTLENIAKESPIVIFIDELDRCRPDFAVQMLEVIKHTFNVDGVQFVLVTNTKQLRAAIHHCYGSEVEAQRYLDKFVRFSFRLPNYVPGNRGRNGEAIAAAVEHFANLVKVSSTLKNSELNDRQNGVYHFSISLIENNYLSLREVETFVRHLEIYHRLSDDLGSGIIFGYQLLYIFAVYAFCFAPELTLSIQQNRSDAEVVLGVIGFSSLPDYVSDLNNLTHTELIAVLLAQGSTLNREITSLSPEAQEEFEQLKTRYFRTRFGVPERVYEPIKEAIKWLHLAGK